MNRKLKQLVADLSRDKHILQVVLSKNSDAWATTRTRRVPFRGIMASASGAAASRSTSIVRWFDISRSSRLGTAASPLPRVSADADEVRVSHVLHHTMPQELIVVNYKPLYRLYRQDGLRLRLTKPRRKVSAADRARQLAAAANEMWSMEFISDALFNGRHPPGPNRHRHLHPRGASDRCRSRRHGRAGRQRDNTDRQHPRFTQAYSVDNSHELIFRALYHRAYKRWGRARLQTGQAD